MKQNNPHMAFPSPWPSSVALEQGSMLRAATLMKSSRAGLGSGRPAGGWRPALCSRASTSGSRSTSRVSSASCSSTARPVDHNRTTMPLQLHCSDTRVVNRQR